MLDLRISTEAPYTYTVLRYVHDIATAEFINVGVVVAACDLNCVAAKFKTDCRRVQGAFPSLDTEVFLARMMRLQACFNVVDPRRCAEVRAIEGSSVAVLVSCVLPLEDSALHWSPIGSCAGGPLAATLDLLYERLITKHDVRPGRRNSSFGSLCLSLSQGFSNRQPSELPLPPLQTKDLT